MMKRVRKNYHHVWTTSCTSLHCSGKFSLLLFHQQVCEHYLCVNVLSKVYLSKHLFQIFFFFVDMFQFQNFIFLLKIFQFWWRESKYHIQNCISKLYLHFVHQAISLCFKKRSIYATVIY